MTNHIPPLNQREKKLIATIVKMEEKLDYYKKAVLGLEGQKKSLENEKGVLVNKLRQGKHYESV